MSDFDVCVVGAGVVGLAVARALTLGGRSVVVVEARAAFGEETSSRNSEVIHSGIYYPTGSLKARLCVTGRAALYAFCAARGVPHINCGKLIVAADASEMAGLEALARKGAQNGVEDLRLLCAREAKALEPALACVGALLAPATGILDSHAYMLALQADAEGAAFAYRAPFLSARREPNGLTVEIGGATPARMSVGALVNAAGLSASRVALGVEGLADIPQTQFAKGNYFALAGRAPFRRLIYPAPQAHGLGVHLTFDLAGQARFGPDVEWVERLDYHVNPERARGFADAIRRYWPELPDDALSPAYAGIRPKISGPAEATADFRIDGPTAHGIAGLVNLYGIESPGLTASLAIAEHVAMLL